ncbi:MAG: ribbon-helix-helix domain-containing protein [Pyrobaculum sp.]
MARLVLVSFHVEVEVLDTLEMLVKHGVFKNRSEAIRFAIKELLRREEIIKALEEINKMKEQYEEEIELEKKLLQGRW